MLYTSFGERDIQEGSPLVADKDVEGKTYFLKKVFNFNLKKKYGLNCGIIIFLFMLGNFFLNI